MQRNEDPSKAETVAQLLSGRSTFFEKSQNVQVVAKLPIYHVAKLDAMAKQAGKNRTEMLSILLSTGLDEVLKHVDEAVAEKLLQLEAEAMARLLGED